MKNIAGVVLMFLVLCFIWPSIGYWTMGIMLTLALLFLVLAVILALFGSSLKAIALLGGAYFAKQKIQKSVGQRQVSTPKMPVSEEQPPPTLSERFKELSTLYGHKAD